MKLILTAIATYIYISFFNFEISGNFKAVFEKKYFNEKEEFSNLILEGNDFTIT